MAHQPDLRTARLVLRAFRDADLPAFAAMNADPAVMEYMPACLSRAESDALACRIRAHHDAHGFGLFAVEVVGGAAFIGYVGLSIPGFEARFTPCVEVGWRLARAAWGKGYATEAARASLSFGFEGRGLDEIVSFTVPANARSLAVMKRLGMHTSREDEFDHPKLAPGHPLRRHVLYRLARAEWRGGAGDDERRG